MSNVLTFDKIKEKTFDDAIATIKECKPPKTWNEMVEGDKEGHIGIRNYYKQEAEKEEYKLNNRGLYFFITKEDKFYYIGRFEYNTLNRLYRHQWEQKKRECYVAILDFPEWVTSQHLKFFKTLFIVLAGPEANRRDGTGWWPQECFKLIGNKKITIEEIYSIRVYYKPE